MYKVKFGFNYEIPTTEVEEEYFKSVFIELPIMPFNGMLIDVLSFIPSHIFAKADNEYHKNANDAKMDEGLQLLLECSYPLQDQFYMVEGLVFCKGYILVKICNVNNIGNDELYPNSFPKQCKLCQNQQ